MLMGSEINQAMPKSSRRLQEEVELLIRILQSLHIRKRLFQPLIQVSAHAMARGAARKADLTLELEPSAGHPRQLNHRGAALPP